METVSRSSTTFACAHIHEEECELHRRFMRIAAQMGWNRDTLASLLAAQLSGGCERGHPPVNLAATPSAAVMSPTGGCDLPDGSLGDAAGIGRSPLAFTIAEQDAVHADQWPTPREAAYPATSPAQSDTRQSETPKGTPCAFPAPVTCVTTRNRRRRTYIISPSGLSDDSFGPDVDDSPSRLVRPCGSSTQWDDFSAPPAGTPLSGSPFVAPDGSAYAAAGVHDCWADYPASGSGGRAISCEGVEFDARLSPSAVQSDADNGLPASSAHSTPTGGVADIEQSSSETDAAGAPATVVPIPAQESTNRAGTYESEDDDSDNIPLSLIRSRAAAVLPPSQAFTSTAMPSTPKPAAPSYLSDDAPSDIDSGRPRRAGAPRATARRKSGIRARYFDEEADSTDSSTEQGSDRDERFRDVAQDSDSDTDVGDAADDEDAYDYNDGFLVGDDEGSEDEAADDDSTGASGTDGESTTSTSCSDTDMKRRRKAPAADRSFGISTGESRPRAMNVRDGDVHPSTGRIAISVEHGHSAHEDVTAADTKRGFRTRAFRDQLTRALFLEYNEVVFDSQLPVEMEISWGARLRKTAGMTYTSMRRGATASVGGYFARIVLSTKVVDTAFKLAQVRTACRLVPGSALSTITSQIRRAIVQTLLHELCHAAAWLVDHNNRPPHGAAFQCWARRASREYPLRAVTTCHSYEIAYKFTYQCVSCFMQYGRHSNSIDTSTARCGRCMASLILSGGASSMAARDGGAAAATPAVRQPNKYAEFIASNRKVVAATNPGMTPQQVFKEVARLWSERKAGGAKAVDLTADGGDDVENQDVMAAPVRIPTSGACGVPPLVEEDDAIIDLTQTLERATL